MQKNIVPCLNSPVQREHFALTQVEGSRSRQASASTKFPDLQHDNRNCEGKSRVAPSKMNTYTHRHCRVLLYIRQSELQTLPRVYFSSVSCFFWVTFFFSLAVVTVEDLLKLNPDKVCHAVLHAESTSSRGTSCEHPPLSRLFLPFLWLFT